MADEDNGRLDVEHLTALAHATRAELIRRGRGKFAAMAVTYALGVFNDNFFKQAASLLAISLGFSWLQGAAAVVFTVPFLLFAAPAGWLADRFPKRRIVIAAKVLEVAAMACGAAGICTTHWGLMLAMVGMMGLHSTIFSPALNGSIPELYPADYVLTANSILKMATTLAILLGIILAGLALAHKEVGPSGLVAGRAIVAAAVVAVSAAGLAFSFFVPRRPAADPQAKFPWSGPVDTVRVLAGLRRDKLLAIVVALDAYVWFVAALQVLLINRMGLSQFGYGDARTSYLVVAELAGVAAGGILCAKVAAGGRWLRLQAPAAAALAAGMLILGLAGNSWFEPRYGLLCGLLVWAGVAGGMLLVPLESFIQARPAPERKGQVIAAANFAAFAGIALSGLAFLAIDRTMAPTTGFAGAGALTLIVAGWVAVALPRTENR